MTLQRTVVLYQKKIKITAEAVYVIRRKTECNQVENNIRLTVITYQAFGLDQNDLNQVIRFRSF